jgi:hypothetical protein
MGLLWSMVVCCHEGSAFSFFDVRVVPSDSYTFRAHEPCLLTYRNPQRLSIRAADKTLINLYCCYLGVKSPMFDPYQRPFSSPPPAYSPWTDCRWRVPVARWKTRSFRPCYMGGYGPCACGRSRRAPGSRPGFGDTDRTCPFDWQRDAVAISAESSGGANLALLLLLW